MKTLATMFVLIGMAQAQSVCIRPIGLLEQDQTVVQQFQKRGFNASVCGKARQMLEVWYYPMTQTITSNTTSFWLYTNRVYPHNYLGQVSTYTPSFQENQWTVTWVVDGAPAKRRWGASLSLAAKELAREVKR